MDLDEARALLGVDADASGDQLRRAYLRAVRRHPAERDPEGFKRVRAAYELLTEQGTPGLGGEPPKPTVRLVAVVPATPPRDETTAEAAPIAAPYREDPRESLRIVVAALEAGHPVRAARLYREGLEKLVEFGMLTVELGDDIALALFQGAKGRAGRAQVQVVSELVAGRGMAHRVAASPRGLLHAAIRDLAQVSLTLPTHLVVGLAGALAGADAPSVRGLRTDSLVSKALRAHAALDALIPRAPVAPRQTSLPGQGWLRWWPLLPFAPLFVRCLSSGVPSSPLPSFDPAPPVHATAPNVLPYNVEPRAPSPTPLADPISSTPALVPSVAPLALPGLPPRKESFSSVGSALSLEALREERPILYKLGMDLKSAKDCEAARRLRALVAAELVDPVPSLPAARAAVAFVDRACGAGSEGK